MVSHHQCSTPCHGGCCHHFTSLTRWPSPPARSPHHIPHHGHCQHHHEQKALHPPTGKAVVTAACRASIPLTAATTWLVSHLHRVRHQIHMLMTKTDHHGADPLRELTGMPPTPWKPSIPYGRRHYYREGHLQWFQTAISCGFEPLLIIKGYQ
jgi:hypothetical protein